MPSLGNYRTQGSGKESIFENQNLYTTQKSMTSSMAETRVLVPEAAHFRSLRGLEKKKKSLERHKSSIQSSAMVEQYSIGEDVETTLPTGHLGKLDSPRI